MNPDNLTSVKRDD